MRRTVLRGLAAFRLLAWGWMATVLVLARGGLVAPGTAFALVALAGIVTAWSTWSLRSDPARLLRGPEVGAEVGVALALLLADGFVYAAPHVFTSEQPLGVAWSLAGLLASGTAFGPVVGAATGVALGAARATSSILNVAPATEAWLGPLTAEQGLSLATTTVLYALAGGVAGHATRLLIATEQRVVRAERELAELRAREDVGRRLHDGVLQTLALVERRADDHDLARLAREQERELRRYLVEGPAPTVVGAGALGDGLRAAADRTERTFGIRAQVLVSDDVPDLDVTVLEALVAAVGEALTNAGKHAKASRVVVYVEPEDDEVFVSVRDDGVGFEPTALVEGVGLSRSIRGRIEEIGGDVEVAGRPRGGVEVRLRVPAHSP